MKIKATWEMDYDYRTDKCYKAPMHKECDAPIVLNEGLYLCIGCGKEAEIDDKMKQWIDERHGTRTETQTCVNCKNNTMKIYYYKNHANKKWQVGSGECTSCGMRFIV